MVDNASAGDFMHTVIYGPPGTGKTEVAKIIGKIFANLGILKKGTFKKVTRSDLVSGYLGQTAIKTRDVINECLGGCLFIDEAYSLGNTEKRDSFSKECIDTLCEAMSDHKHDLMVIIAGYEDELYETFFKANKGLESRFTWRFKIDQYCAKELMQIFLKKILENDWKIEVPEKEMGQWFESKSASFKHFGRDMELLFSYTKIAHGRRIYGKSNDLRKIIHLDDLDRGYKSFVANSKKKAEIPIVFGLYT
jgi:SpoVK/Ycf46/Vps4 family AAA+-type ATPase